MTQANHRPRALVVLMSMAYEVADGVENPYSLLFCRSLPGSVVPLSFSWRRAFTGRYDLFHIHWPESLMRGRTPSRSMARMFLTVLLLLRCRLTRTAIVRTVHNEDPHESGNALERQVLQLVDRSTAAWIVMNSDTRTPPGSSSWWIPHGHYRDWYRMPAECDVERGKLLYFGAIRPYKNLTGLLHAFGEVPMEGGLHLEIRGRPSSEDMRREVEDASRDLPNVRLSLEYAPSEELIDAISRAHLVVLPYERFHNSGAAILALSVGRPILIPNSGSARELLKEFGSRYIKIFDGELTGEALASAVSSIDPVGLPKPDMASREWSALGEAVEGVYRVAFARARS